MASRLVSGLDRLEARIRHAENERLYGIWRRVKQGRVVAALPYNNIYHCCTQKTASMWFKRVFADPITHKYTGLDIFPLEWRESRYFHIAEDLREISFSRPLPDKTVGVNLYIHYPTFLAIPKAASYKAFFVFRDPRDIVVSWYFSARYTHSPLTPIVRIRHDLAGLGPKEGLLYAIDYLDRVGLFEAQRSWALAPPQNHTFRPFYYEDLARDNVVFLQDLFAFLGIHLPQNAFQQLVERHRFAGLATLPIIARGLPETGRIILTAGRPIISRKSPAIYSTR
jgi:hypothetical protein